MNVGDLSPLVIRTERRREVVLLGRCEFPSPPEGRVACVTGETERDRCCCMAEVLKVEDISKELQVSVRRARELIRSGKIRVIPGLNPKTIRVSREDLDAFISDSTGK